MQSFAHIIIVAPILMAGCLKSQPAQSHVNSQPASSGISSPSPGGESLKGKWDQVVMIIDGHPNDEKAAREFQYSFDGKQFAYVRNGKEVSKGSYDLDVTKSPAAIDLLEPTGVRIYGIYRVEKDKLTLCLSEDRRPSDFEPGRRRILAIALRQQ